MTLDPKWVSLTGPFKDNTTGLIHALTLRQFAGDVAAQVVGGAGLTFRGAYSAGNTYATDDVVTISGSAYVNTAGPLIGVSPPTSPWALLVAKGADGAAGTNGTNGTNGTDGADGAGFTFRGTYSGATTYQPNEVVALSGSSYVLTGSSPSTGVSPPSAPWAVLAAAGAAGSVTYGTTAGTAAEGNDARLSNTRTPTDGTVTTAKVASGGLAPSAITGTAVVTTDPRLIDARTPTDNSVTTIKVVANAITNAKLATVATGTVKGNASGSTAAPSDLSMATLATMLNGVLAATQISVDSAGGATGPSVQTAIQALVDFVSIDLTFD